MRNCEREMKRDPPFFKETYLEMINEKNNNCHNKLGK
jgi:hypothetical protein